MISNRCDGYWKSELFTLLLPLFVYINIDNIFNVVKSYIITVYRIIFSFFRTYNKSNKSKCGKLIKKNPPNLCNYSGLFVKIRT